MNPCGIIIYFNLLACVLLMSCKQELDVKKYRENLKKFPKKHVGHFLPPQEIDKAYNYMISPIPDETTPVNFYLTTEKHGSYTDSLRKELKKMNYPSFRATDTNFLIVNKPATEENWFEVSSYNIQSDYQNYSKDKYPIPNFYWHSHKDNSTYSKLPENYELYVIEAINGMVMEDSTYHQRDWFMPEQWKDGLSRGIAIDTSTNRLLYWLIIW